MPPFILARVLGCLCSPLFPSFISQEPPLHRATGSLWSSFVWNRKQPSSRQMPSCRCRAWQADGAFELPGKTNNNPLPLALPCCCSTRLDKRTIGPSRFPCATQPRSLPSHNGCVARPLHTHTSRSWLAWLPSAHCPICGTPVHLHVALCLFPENVALSDNLFASL